MARNEKIVKDFIYTELGLPVLLENALFHKVRDEWLLKIAAFKT